MAESKDETDPVLHVVVVGFHHKRGCQVDFSYPPLIEGHSLDSHDVPEQWKYLPFLALPDGAHNYTEDTVYFHLPDKDNLNQTIYGVSCFRQIESKDLLNKTADVTRGTVLKSVCVLSKLPLYGLFQAKLQLITYAYFKERDFSKTEILKQLYESLSSSISSSLTGEPSQIYLGLSVRELIMQFKHKVLVLFKLLLLERRILMFGSPVKTLCGTILSFVSLFPGMIERGLLECTSYGTGQPQTTDIRLTEFGIETEEYLDVQITDLPNYSQKRTNQSPPQVQGNHGDKETQKQINLKMQYELQQENNEKRHAEEYANSVKDVKNISRNNVQTSGSDGHLQKTETFRSSECNKKESPRTEEDDLLDLIDQELGEGSEKSPVDMDTESDKDFTRTSDDDVFHNEIDRDKPLSLSSLSNHESDDDYTIIQSPQMPDFTVDQYGFPLALFTKGSLCHPYVSLQQHELLKDINVRSFLIGATNCLYKQKKHFLDVIVDLEENKILIQENELKKQLNLSTADLRFADTLVRNVIDEKENTFLDPTGWEGGEEWLRLQFKRYIQTLLATVEFSDDEDHLHDFNHHFVNAWKTTHNYRVWKTMDHPAITQHLQKHLCHGNLSVADMRLRLKSTDQGRKLTNAMSKTGSAVIQTGRMFGGAFTSAKSAVSSTVTSWFSGLMDDDKTDSEEDS
ncbi:late secretory pathway protein AVL9 homolog [Glandiceps talaboti]